MNPNTLEMRAVRAVLDERVSRYRTQLESESTEVAELPLVRAKLAATIHLKKQIEELFREPESR